MEFLDGSHRLEKEQAKSEDLKINLLQQAGIKSNGLGYVIDDLTKFSSLLDDLKERPSYEFDQRSKRHVDELIKETLDTLIMRSLSIETEVARTEATEQLSRLCGVLQQVRTLGIESINHLPLDLSGELEGVPINTQIPELITMINNESTRISNIPIRNKKLPEDTSLRFLFNDEDE